MFKTFRPPALGMVMGDERGPTLGIRHPNVAFVACGNSHCRHRTCLEQVHFERDIVQIFIFSTWRVRPRRRTRGTHDLMLQRLKPTLQTQVSDHIASLLTFTLHRILS